MYATLSKLEAIKQLLSETKSRGIDQEKIVHDPSKWPSISKINEMQTKIQASYQGINVEEVQTALKENILFRGRKNLLIPVWENQLSSFLLTVYHSKARKELTAVLSAVHTGPTYIDDKVLDLVDDDAGHFALGKRKASEEDAIELMLVYEFHKETKIFRIRCTKTTALSKVFGKFCEFCGFDDVGLPIKNEVKFSFDGDPLEIDTTMTIAQLEKNIYGEWTENDVIDVSFSEHLNKLLKLASEWETSNSPLNQNVQRVFSNTPENFEVRERHIRIGGQKFSMKQLITSIKDEVKDNFDRNISSKFHTGDDIIELFFGRFTYDLTREHFMRDTLFGNDEYVSYSRKIKAVFYGPMLT